MKISKKLAISLAVSSCLTQIVATQSISADSKSAAKSQSGYKEMLAQATATLNAAKQQRKNVSSDQLSKTHSMLEKAADQAQAQGDDATLADIYMAMGEYRFVSRGLQMTDLEKALQIRQRLYGANHPKVAEAMSRTAVMCVWLRDYARATELFKNAIAIVDANKGAGARLLGESLEDAAQRGFTNRTGDVGKVMRRALTTMRKYLAKDDAAIISCLHALGVATQSDNSNSLKQDNEEPNYIAEAEALLKKKTPNDPKIASVIESQAQALSRKGQSKEAAAAYREVVAIRQKNAGNPDELARTYERMADYLRDSNQFPEGHEFVMKALAIYEKHPGESQLSLINGLNHAIYYHEHSAKPELAIPFYERRIAMKDRFLGQPKEFAALCMRLHKYERAVPLLTKCLSYAEKNNSGNPMSYEIAQICLDLGVAYTQLGKLSDAQVNLDKAKQVYLKSGYESIPFLEAYTQYLQKAGKQAEYATFKAKLEQLKQAELKACRACGMG